MSTSEYFPEFGNQGEMNSCAAWATTYYQFTYEVNKFREVKTTSDTVYSPSWTYNYTNMGVNGGTSLADDYLVLKNQGAMFLKDDPYSPYSSSYSFDWPTDLDKMRAALEYRIINDDVHRKATIDDAYNNRCFINAIKSQISQGSVGVIYTNALGWTVKENSDHQKAIVRGSSYGSGGHAVTIVGYDDDYSITVNGTTLKGAFKIANSWSKDWGNNGYIWVSYDALFNESNYGTAWQKNLLGTRESVFPQGIAYFVKVGRCDNLFIETLEFKTNVPDKLSVYLSHGESAQKDNNNLVKKSLEGAPQLDNVVKRYLVFDYSRPYQRLILSNSLDAYWTVNICGNEKWLSTYDIGATLTDNLGKEIEPFDKTYYIMNNGEFKKTHHSKIAMGRLSAYDNNDITSEDVNVLLKYLTNYVKLSKLQRELADYNGDGSVNVSDAVAMNAHISSKNKIPSYSIYDKLPGQDMSVAKFMEKELKMSPEEFISNHEDILTPSGVAKWEE